MKCTTKVLYDLYYMKHGNCCICGKELESNAGVGSVYTMDKGGNLFCAKHDWIFSDEWDEHIFSPETDNEIGDNYPEEDPEVTVYLPEREQYVRIKEGHDKCAIQYTTVEQNGFIDEIGDIALPRPFAETYTTALDAVEDVLETLFGSDNSMQYFRVLY